MSQSASISDTSVAASVQQAWDVTWQRFYLPRTNLFYDYLTSYEPGKELAHLPTVEEAKRQYPNECGYGTGMEDCMISAGTMLSLIVDRYAVTGEESLRDSARKVLAGIQRCTMDHGVPGFVARGVCAEDLKTIYPNTSRDQYTHVVHGLWMYYHSPLSDEAVREQIKVLLAAIADRMIETIIPENDYDSLRSDGTHDTRGISRMWNVKGHEAARLPMIYAAAWDTTGKQKYYDEYRKYVVEAVKQSKTVEDNQPTYAWLQMQASLELLAALEKDVELKQQMHEIMIDIAKRCASRARWASKTADKVDLTELCTNWRTDEALKWEGKYRRIWYCIRESGEAAVTQLILDQPFPEGQKALLVRAITRLDYQRVSSNGIFYLQTAYWKMRRRETAR